MLDRLDSLRAEQHAIIDEIGTLIPKAEMEDPHFDWRYPNFEVGRRIAWLRTQLIIIEETSRVLRETIDSYSPAAPMP